MIIIINFVRYRERLDGIVRALRIPSATIQELVCNASLDAGIYFVGGAVQSAPVTQPTIRAINGATVPETPLPLGTFIPGAAANFFAYMLGGVAGALPASGSALTPTAGIAPRVFVRIK